MERQDELERFEQIMLPHLDAAYNLARWLARSDSDAEDVVQEAYLRAFRFFKGFHGTNGRVWLLTIVRNVYYNLVGRSTALELPTAFYEETHSLTSDDFNPERHTLQHAESHCLQKALEEAVQGGARTAGAARAGGSVVQRDCGDRRDSDRYGNVALGPRSGDPEKAA